MRTHWARKGRPDTLNCTLSIPVDANYSLEWRKNGQLILSAYGNESGHAAPNLQGRIARSDGLGLTIHSIERDDEALYVCSITHFRASSPTSPVLGTPVRLVVNVPPIITEPASGEVIFAEEGKPLEARCSSSAVPPPEVSWIRHGKIASGSSVLRISNVKIGDQGTYSCVAANSEGRVETSVYVSFPKKVNFDYTPQNKSVVEGSSSFWNCHATGYPDRINYEWKFEGAPVRTTPVGLRARIVKGELAIRNVRKDDRGWYSCHASNIFGESITKAFLDVQYLPVILESNPEVYTMAVGSNVTLNCAADSNPSVNMVNWSRNGHLIATKDKDTFDLINVSTADAGLYTCEVFNALGRGNPYEMHLIVAQPPHFVVKPAPEIRVKLGSKLELKCSGFADPTPIQYWVRKEERVASEEFIIDKADYEHDGIYECVISNAVETLRTETRVFVENTRPHASEISEVSCDGESALKIKWNKGYDGGHPQRFLVYCEEENEEGQPSGQSRRAETDQNEVTVSDLSRFGKYRITVESVNKLGSANSTSIDRHVCTRIPSPEDVRLERDRLTWQPVEGALSYRVEMKKGGHYTHLAEVLRPQYSIRHISQVTEDVDLRVIGLRPPFPPSQPSRPVTIALRETSTDGQLAIALCLGFLFFAFLALIYLLLRRNSIKLKRKQKKVAGHSPTTTTFGCSVHAPQIVRQMYEPRSVPPSNLAEDECASGFSRGSRDHFVRCVDGPYESSNNRESTLASSSSHSHHRSFIPYDHDGISIERESVLGDMLRSKYFVENDDPHGALIDELRLARLKKEYQQSQL